MNNGGGHGCHCGGYKKKYYMPEYKKADHYGGILEEEEYGHEEGHGYDRR